MIIALETLSKVCAYSLVCDKLTFGLVCKTPQVSGITVPGTFQQYVLSFASHVTRIPSNYPLEYAAPLYGDNDFVPLFMLF